MTVNAFAALSSRSHLTPFEYDPGPLGPEEADVLVTHCGICHSDVAMVDNTWGATRYPFVPGHEVVGTVTAVGSNVDRLKTGQRVGVGPLSGSCMKCETCESGRHIDCLKAVMTGFGHQGGFATRMRVKNWQFAYPLPEAIASEHAGPLMCAGATVFTPILRHGVRPRDRVAVAGIGGLGHLAVQFLSKWGCDVTAISSTHEKDEQVRQLGASHCIATRGTSELRKASGSFDFIMCTASSALPWDEYVGALRPRGKLCLVGIPEKPVSFGAFGLITGEKSIVGGQTGSVDDTWKMLAFSARHGIRPIIETFPMVDADRALERARSGKAQFRVVLVA
jgi:uncharacterized zinc-type alcohol dehydrogenase-like protein